MPKISVVMPVLNRERYLRDAIESILVQSFADFEFIIINDGSTDKTEEIIKSYNDPRIVYINNNANLGLARSFNVGIRASLGSYIARMDADDIALKERLDKQVRLLELGNADIVGSAVILIDEHGRKVGNFSRPLKHRDIKWQSLSSTPMIHPTVMARAETLKANPYDESFHNSEDYELWSRLLFTTTTRFANIKEPLLLYRIARSSFTRKLDTEKRAVSANNSLRNLEHYIQISESERAASLVMRQGERLSFKQSWIILELYIRAAESFCRQEKLSLTESLIMKTKPFITLLSLIKHRLRH